MKLSERLATRPKPLPEAQQNSKNAFDNEVRSYLSQRFVDEGASNMGSSNMDSPKAGKSLMYTGPEEMLLECLIVEELLLMQSRPDVPLQKKPGFMFVIVEQDCLPQPDQGRSVIQHPK